MYDADLPSLSWDLYAFLISRKRKEKAVLYVSLSRYDTENVQSFDVFVPVESHKTLIEHQKNNIEF